MMHRVLTLAFIIVIIVNASAQGKPEVPKDEVIREKKRLSDIDKKLKEKQEAIRTVEAKERKTLEQLDKIDKKLARNRTELKRLDSKLKNLKEESAALDQQLSELHQGVSAHQKLFNQRLAALYRYQRSGGILRTIFSSRSYLDLSRRTKFIIAILRQDQQIVHRFLDQLALVKDKKAALQKNSLLLEKTKGRIIDKKSQIVKQKKKKSALLKTIKNEKGKYLAALKELEKASLELQALIDGLEKQRHTKKVSLPPVKGTGFSAFKGKLPLPVAGNIISHYGKRIDPELNTAFFHKGIEIEAKEGEEIKAIYEGTVLYADWFKGYGNIIIVDHGDNYYSLSGHLSKILKHPGDRVEAGEVIALSGDTGSLKGPCLYFELRHRGKTLDPLPWLKTP